MNLLIYHKSDAVGFLGSLSKGQKLKLPNAQKANVKLELDKKQFNVKLQFKVTQVHVLWGHWKGDDGLNNTI